MLRTKTGYRTLKFEQNVLKTEGRKWVKRYLEGREINTNTRNAQERLQYLNRNGFNQESLLQMEQDNKDVCSILKTRDEEIQTGAM